MKSSTPASAAIAAAVIGLSPVTMTVLMPMARRAAKRSLMSGLTISLRSTTPSRRPLLADGERRAAGAGDARRPPRVNSLGAFSAEARCSRMASTAPLRRERPPRSTPGHAGMGGEGDHRAFGGRRQARSP